MAEQETTKILTFRLIALVLLLFWELVVVLGFGSGFFWLCCGLLGFFLNKWLNYKDYGQPKKPEFWEW